MWSFHLLWVFAFLSSAVSESVSQLFVVLSFILLFTDLKVGYSSDNDAYRLNTESYSISDLSFSESPFAIVIYSDGFELTTACPEGFACAA